ncbi:MAG: hypothetical protein RMJ15_02970 [Nitrososphaerota archaeon]|nr:hypothetical protein [Candidatus Bathyarchaeota archaeon]MDW8022689.1 hypothetical protein [Nitrososphaerota archaeon]
MHELNFIIDLVEERLAKGNLRWIANFKEIHKDYKMGELTIPIYATGSLEEKGFILSRIFSYFVTPKFKIHFLFYAYPEVDVKLLRKLITLSKDKFVGDDWIFIGIVQSKPIGKALKDAIESIADDRIGVTVCSLASKTEVSSKNVLGKALQRQLRLAEAKFEAFDLPSYLKSFTITFSLGTLALITIAFLAKTSTAVQPLTLLILAFLSVIVGHRIYKKRYHMTLTLNNEGFKLQEGSNKVIEEKWSSFTDLAFYITPKKETCLRLYLKEGATIDLPISRVGISRKDAYNIIKQLIERK